MVSYPKQSDAKYIEELEQALNDAVSQLLKSRLELADAELEIANLRAYIAMKGGSNE